MVAKQIEKKSTMNFCNNDWSFKAKGVATRSDENEQNCSQDNTKLFRSSLDLHHKHDDAPVVRSDGKNTMLLFFY